MSVHQPTTTTISKKRRALNLELIPTTTTTNTTRQSIEDQPFIAITVRGRRGKGSRKLAYHSLLLEFNHDNKKGSLYFQCPSRSRPRTEGCLRAMVLKKDYDIGGPITGTLSFIPNGGCSGRCKDLTKRLTPSPSTDNNFISHLQDLLIYMDSRIYKETFPLWMKAGQLAGERLRSRHLPHCPWCSSFFNDNTNHHNHQLVTNRKEMVGKQKLFYTDMLTVFAHIQMEGKLTSFGLSRLCRFVFNTSEDTLSKLHYGEGVGCNCYPLLTQEGVLHRFSDFLIHQHYLPPLPKEHTRCTRGRVLKWGCMSSVVFDQYFTLTDSTNPLADEKLIEMGLQPYRAGPSNGCDCASGEYGQFYNAAHVFSNWLLECGLASVEEFRGSNYTSTCPSGRLQCQQEVLKYFEEEGKRRGWRRFREVFETDGDFNPKEPMFVFCKRREEGHLYPSMYFGEPHGRVYVGRSSFYGFPHRRYFKANRDVLLMEKQRPQPIFQRASGMGRVMADEQQQPQQFMGPLPSGGRVAYAVYFIDPNGISTWDDPRVGDNMNRHIPAGEGGVQQQPQIPYNNLTQQPWGWAQPPQSQLLYHHQLMNGPTQQQQQFYPPQMSMPTTATTPRR